MSRRQVVVLTALALVAFAGNSLLCRVALRSGAIDAASFTAVRLGSGALALALIVRLRGPGPAGAGNWPSALALFAYAAGFSFAYLELTAATGALLLFGAVQATMIGWGLARGERLRRRHLAGFLLALGGLAGLLAPGLSRPPLAGSLLMLGAGAAWGVYSLRGRGAGDPTRVTAGNFLRAVPCALLLLLALHPRPPRLGAGVGWAVASGALASGVGYSLWYAALPALRATSAATVQLAVPVLAAAGGVLLLGETPTPRLLVAAAAVLGGIAMVVVPDRPAPVEYPPPPRAPRR